MCGGEGGVSYGPEVIKHFMLNSAEHEIVNAQKYNNIKNSTFFQAHLSP